MRAVTPLRRLALACLLVLWITLSISAGTIYVDDDASESADGSSWQNAYPFLQDALADANLASEGVEIRVAQGTYRPDQSSAHPDGTGDREVSFHLPDGIAMKGGFAGIGAADPDARDISRYATVLSGDLQDNDAPVIHARNLLEDSSRADNSFCIARMEGSGASVYTLLDGFTISCANGESALRIATPCPSVRNCTFANNASGAAGAVYGAVSSRLEIADCRFLRNTAQWGAAVCASSGRSYGPPFPGTIDGCTFIENHAEQGGAVLGGFGEIKNSVFVRNSAVRGGAISGAPNVVGCVFIQNSAVEWGGAIVCAPVNVRNCLFACNSAAEGGAICFPDYSRANITCSTFWINAGAHGRAVASWDTLYDPPRGFATITNTILRNGGDEIYSVSAEVTANTTVTYSNIEGGWPGEGNIDTDPLFAAPGYWDPNGTPDNPDDDFFVDGDYHLKSQAGRWNREGASWVMDEVTSPCIDAGDPNTPFGDEPLYNGARVNMGAYGGTIEASKSEFDEPVSALAYPDPNGRLVYGTYANCGDTRQVNRLPDWSRCGYMGGGVAIPDVPTAITIGPVAGDNTSHIQTAIDTVAQLPPDANGFRGAVLLERGVYPVEGTLRITASGIVLRGEGQSSDGSVIVDTGETQDTLIEVEGGARTELTNTRTRIVDSFVPVGASSFRVASARGLDVGDRVIVHRQTNDKWIDDLDMRQYGWTASYYEDRWERVIFARMSDEITLDAPVVQAIDEQYGGGEVYTYAATNRLSNVGIEDLGLESEYAFATDENHGWSAIALRNVEDAWVRRVTGRYFGYSCVSALSGAKNVTIEDCACLDPKSQITGSRRYSFYLDDCCFVLVQRCFAREGRHDFVTGSRVPGPNAFVDCLAIDGHADSGNHHRYAEGTLFDNVCVAKLAVENREDSGSGHGWSGAQTMFWNCEASTVCQAPVGAMNWAVGVVGKQALGSWAPTEPLGWWESHNTHVWPRSLYYQQLADRLGAQAVVNVTTSAQRSGTIWSQLLLSGP
ncbi:MAG: hypothetical protein JW993_11075 [Sedimentisphaerales bacterium]|nr:hypothetical protein [Sedimentisphaerales bacterium]